MSKKLTLLLLFIVPFIGKATNYTSNSNGNWSSSATWTPTGVPGSGDTVTIANTVTLDANESIKKITINSGKTFTINAGMTLTVYGDFTDNGTFTNTGVNSGLSFNGSVNQTISGTATPISFKNLTINTAASTDTVKLGKAIFVNDSLAITSGTLACVTFSITGNGTGTFTMASGTTLVLGIPSSSTLPGFPSGFTNEHISLNPASNVVYQADNTVTGQTVTTAPYYGNLFVTSSSAGTQATALFYVLGNLNIGAGVTFKLNATTDSIKGNISIASTGTCKPLGSSAYLSGNLVNNGTFSASGAFYFYGSSNQLISGPTGNPINTTFTTLLILPKVSTDTTFIEANIKASTLDNGGTVFVPAAYNDTIGLANVNNSGTITALNGVAYITAGQLKTNAFNFYKMTVGSNSLQYANVTVASDLTIRTGTYGISSGTLNVHGNYINNGGIFSGTVIMSGSHNQTISGTGTLIGSIQINQSASTDTLKLASSITCYAMTITQGVLDVTTSNYGITIEQNWNNNNATSSFVARNGTVTCTPYNTSTNETLGGSASTTFYNLTTNSTGTGIINMGIAETVTNSLTISAGDFITENFPLTVNSSTTLTMGANSLFAIGSNGYSTVIAFPGFTRSNMSLASTSTIDYLCATGSQVISTVPLYANLLIAGNVSASKYISGTHLIVNGNLTVNPYVGLGIAADTVDVGGSVIIVLPGAISMTTGLLNIGGNFTNGGYFTKGTGTVVLNGTTGQTIGGTAVTNFNNLTLSSSGSETITLTTNETVWGAFLVSTGTFTLGGAYHTLSISSTFTNNSTLSATSGTVVFNGTSAQTIGGSSSTSFYNLTCNGTTVTLGLNQTVSDSLLVKTGTLDVSTSNYGLTVGGNFANNAAFTPRSGTVTFNGNGTQLISGTTYPTFYNMTIAGGSGQTVSLGHNQAITNNLLISSGLLDATSSNYNLTIGGNFTSTGGSFNPRSDTVTMTGSSTQTLGGSATLSLSSLIIGTTGTILGGNITTTSNVTINSSATLNASSHTITTAGNFVNNGTFTPSSSTVYFNNTGHQCIKGSSTSTFNNLTVGALSILGNSASGGTNIAGLITILPGGLMDCTCP
ncbi:MAG TPA: hypothetical protein VK783_04915 [Bacteroidia bacterium]|jgi:hypothetical protein|nr:hypothetical protein [Bacteroidia bacterium]